jgi:hypothetical protein
MQRVNDASYAAEGRRDGGRSVLAGALARPVSLAVHPADVPQSSTPQTLPASLGIECESEIFPVAFEDNVQVCTVLALPRNLSS